VIWYQKSEPEMKELKVDLVFKYVIIKAFSFQRFAETLCYLIIVRSWLTLCLLIK